MGIPCCRGTTQEVTFLTEEILLRSEYPLLGIAASESWGGGVGGGVEKQTSEISLDHLSFIGTQCGPLWNLFVGST